LIFGRFQDRRDDEKKGDIFKSRKEELIQNPDLDVVAYNLSKYQ
jgi:hypothetical protein